MNVTMSLLRCLHSATVADLNALVAASGLTYRDAKAAAEGLVADGLARRASPYGSYSITNVGIWQLIKLEDSAQHVADYQAKKDEQQRMVDAKDVRDKAKERRHDFAVSAFSVILALSIEHFADILQFLQKLLALFFEWTSHALSLLP